MSPTSKSGTGRRTQPSALERVLSLFGEVKPGEGGTMLLLFANIFLLLTAYYILKVVREALTLSGVEIFGIKGAEIKSYLSAVMAFLLIGIVPAYAALASRVSRLRLIRLTSFFVVACLIGFSLWGRASGVGTAIGLTFFIWIGIVNVFLIAQFWSYANDIYTEPQGKRLFAIIAIGQSAGAILGPLIASLGANYVFELPLVCSVLFIGCLLLYGAANRRGAGGSKELSAEKKAEDEKPLGKDGAFKLVFSNKYLLLMAFMILTTNVVNTTGEFILSSAAAEHANEQVPGLSEPEQTKAEAAAQTGLAKGTYENLETARAEESEKALRNLRSPVFNRFYGGFFLIVNLVALGIQMFFVSRIFKYFGVRAALFILPVIALGGYAAIGLIGGLLVIRVAKSAENATDYSLQNTIKQALFLPTSREAKYKAKAAIDTFFVRFGDAASAGLVWLGIHILHFTAKGFALVNVGLVVIWIMLNIGIAREHRKLVPDDKHTNT